MRWLTRLQMRLQMLFRRGRAGTQLDEELRFHLEQQIAEYVAHGMDEEEARHAALRAFGNPPALRDQARETWSWSGVELAMRDLRIALRTLLRAPGFALAAILVMGLGIGANIALFTVVHSVLLKPLPFKDPERLMRLYEHSTDDKFPFNSNAAGIFAEWKKQSRSFSDMALAGYAGYNLSGTNGQLPENVRAGVLSWNMLPMLGIEPALGRNFTATEDQPSANGTVLLSWGLWKRRFGGNPGVLNQTILLDGKPYTVIGVMPDWFGYPQQAMQLWTPIYHEVPASEMQTLDNHEWKAIGRLRPGVTRAEAVAELSLITERIHKQHLDDAFVSKAANIRPLLDSIVGDLKTPLYGLLAATACVLLIACLNVANLLVARTAARRKELAIRTALGGSRMRLLREHLMESLILSAVGGAVGLMLAWVVLAWLVSTRQEMARVTAIHFDGAVGGFTVTLVVLCAVFAGLISAFSSKSETVLGALQESSRSYSAGQGRARLRKLLLVMEVGLTVVLLVGAGLLLKSYDRLRSADLGCMTRGVLTMSFDLPKTRYANPAQRANFFDTLLGRVRQLPGVQAAGLVFPVVPGDGYGGDHGFTIPEHPPLPQGQGDYAIDRWIDPGYFSAIGIPLLRGRTFSDNQRPGHATEIVVSELFARQYFPHEDPIGKHLKTNGSHLYEIVGIVGDTRFEVGEPPRPMMYFALDADDDMDGASLIIRSTGDVTRYAIPVQRIVQELDRDLPVSDVLTMDQVIGRNTADANFDVTLLLVFAASSLLLAAVGLFGVLSYVVAQRTGEIGIRMALGAQRGQVAGLMLGDGLRPALYGLVLGLGASAAVTRLIESMLYQTRALDPAVLVLVSLILLIVAGAACLLPAWRASRLNPMQALRTE
ncbi:MAG TPA: ABC transporter permease [Silvibacterium sp.]|nr:ABC transporter permease [Silvibacterium sp.]